MMGTQTRRTASATAWLFAASLLVPAIACSQDDPGAPQKFDSTEAAVDALAAAFETDDRKAFVKIFGADYEDRLITADWDADAEARAEILAAAREHFELQKVGEGELEIVYGAEEWPFPIPLVRDEDGSWRFDTAEGIEELLDRRIGRNELAAIDLMNAYADAQVEYASEDRNGNLVREYAQRLASTPGKRDGLYWEAGPGEPESPFGPLVEQAESYLDSLKPGDPLRGYYFRVLTRQGPNPPGGKYDYVINGNMIAGYALVGYPADYGVTGIMTFVVNQRGVVQQKDLGAFEGMDVYDPDDTWTELLDGSSMAIVPIAVDVLEPQAGD